MKKMNMKKGMALLMALSLATSAMTACGNKNNNDEPATEIDFNDVSDNKTDTETKTETTEEEPVEETREGMYRSEITNEWIDESLKDQRPVAIMVDNESIALPHNGMTESDVV